MRLWSIAPRMLDSKGLVACWRESLLALNVLQGNTKGYKNHPQLDRFKEQPDPVQSICSYLHSILTESRARYYNFDETKIPLDFKQESIPVTIGQIVYEYNLLKNKVMFRTGKWEQLNLDTKNYSSLVLNTNLCIFYVVAGDIEPWEKVK